MKTQSTTQSGSKKQKKKIEKKETYTHDQVMQALLHVNDIMQSCLMDYVILDQVAYQMHANLPCEKISEVSVGVRRNNYTDYARRTLLSIWKGGYFTKETVAHEFGGVPIVIWILDKDLSYIKNPDTVFYYYDVFKIPNPFDLYWHNRDIIS